MNLELAEKKFNEFLKEASKLYYEIGRLDDEVRTPYRKIAVSLDIDDEDFTDYHTCRFYDWTNKVHREVLDLVKSHGLYVKEENNYWIVYPYDVSDTLHEGDTGFDTLCCHLTQESGGFSYGSPRYSLTFDEYCCYIPEDIDVAKTFIDGLKRIDEMRETKLKLVEKVCDELHTQFSVNKLLTDCERYVFETEDEDE